MNTKFTAFKYTLVCSRMTKYFGMLLKKFCFYSLCEYTVYHNIKAFFHTRERATKEVGLKSGQLRIIACSASFCANTGGQLNEQ